MASSPSSRNWRYDVFPSFSGEDVRVTFLSHFLKELDRKSIIAFRDNEIERSRSLNPELTRAIQDSRIAVVVFSKNYASSSWCLNELLEIVKCKKEFGGQLVIPVFYGLDPSHVRKQTGDFGKVFEKTCHNKSEDVKSQWQKALTDVANILGYHFVPWGNEAKMVEKIANDVLGKLLIAPQNDVEDFVGMEDHIAKMIVLLQLESEEVKMVGIWGASGIGKTTIARVLLTRLRPRFQGSVYIDRSFISDIKKSYGKANLDDYNIKLHLQRSFLSEILGQRDLKIDNLGAIKERLRNWKVLICIDDLDDAMVLDALAGQTQWFGSGSRIIVITTNKHLLEAHKIHCIYEVALPSEELAVQIFCRSAFREISPPKGFEKLAVEAVRCVANLPLGLKVLGSALRGHDKKSWERVMSRFRNRNGISLDKKIDDALRISYDALDEEEQVLFRHIACLFNLEKVDDIKLLLADSVSNVEFCLRNLVTKAMLNLRSDIVEMHPLLQKMGKGVVRQQSKPGKQEFLVDSKDICYVLENNTGTKRVIGISLNIDEIEELHIHGNAFKGMDNLRFLKIFSDRFKLEKRVRLHLPDSFDHLPPKLKLLYWDGYPMKRMPSNFRPERLVKLKMENSNLRMLWEGSRKLTCLKEINLWGSENLKEIPDLSMATHLEKLYVGHCLSWVALPSSIRKFNELTELGMLECKNLDTLPTDINLESPKRLSIMGNIKGERLRQGMQPLIRMGATLPGSLRVLLLTDIPNMVELPFSIKNLNKLTDLRITRCTNLVTLPTGINLESLERLNLNGCSRLRTFPDISRNISSLYLEETAIEVVPRWIENFSKLKYLVMQRCSKLEYVHLNISKLKHLEWVNFSYCGALAGADLTGYPNGLSIEEDDAGTKLPVLEEASSSHPDNVVPKVDFSFINCFNLDQEALFQQLSLEKLVLSGEELPLYFTHQTTGTSLAISLLEAPLSPPFFRFKACAVVVFNSKPTFGAIGVSMKVTCRFKGKLENHFDYPFQQEYFSLYQKGSHLFLLDCCMPLNEDDALLAEVNYDQVDIQCHMSSGNSKFKLKEWGIRLSRDGSSPENRLDNPVSLPRLCEADEDNKVNE